MTTVNNRVNTTFTANVGQALGGYQAIAGAASSVGGVIGRLTSMLNPLNIALGGLSVGAAISGISQLGSSFEMTRNTMAGTLAALGVAGGADPTERFRNGLGLAEQTMRQIEVAAARLPGEADDYISIFRAGLPVIQAAVGGSLQEMTEFSNRYTAIARTFGVDAQQAGMDLQRMLRAGRGGAGADVRTFQQLLPFLRTVEGQAALTAESFNRMTDVQRVRILQSAFAGLQPMIDEAGGTFDSMWGALQSTAKTLARQATSPLFDGIKSALGEINALFMDNEGNLTEIGQGIVTIGQNISRYIVDGVRAAVGWMRELGDRMREFTESRPFQVLAEVVRRLGGAVQAVAGGAPGTAAGGGMGAVAAAGMGAAAATGPGALVVALAMGVGNFLTRTEEATAVFNQLVDIVSTAADLFAPMGSVVATVSDLFGDLISGVLPGLLSLVQSLLEPLTTFWSGLMVISNVILTELNPVFEMLFNAVGSLFSAIGDLLGPALRIVSRIFLVLYEVLAFIFAPVISFLVEVFSVLIEKISEFISWLGSLLSEVADHVEAATAEAGRRGVEAPGSSVLDDILAALTAGNDAAGERDARAEAAAAAARRDTPGARGGARTVQDFRFSRFDITQRFAEGFDPDRIAVAFADDLGDIGQQRLQSGFEPIFGVR